MAGKVGMLYAFLIRVVTLPQRVKVSTTRTDLVLEKRMEILRAEAKKPNGS